VIDKELEIARRIQSMILPHEIPALAGIEIAAHYIPMSAVSGDFYDFPRIDEKRAGVLVADVAGHGVPAALIASMLKVAFAGLSQKRTTATAAGKTKPSRRLAISMSARLLCVFPCSPLEYLTPLQQSRNLTRNKIRVSSSI
jgi:hypothetical protein